MLLVVRLHGFADGSLVNLCGSFFLPPLPARGHSRADALALLGSHFLAFQHPVTSRPGEGL
jgi:hypothetical protein